MRKDPSYFPAKSRRGPLAFDVAATEPLESRRLFASGFLTEAPPYVVPSAPGVETTPILTVGDAAPESDASKDRVDFTFVNGVMTPVRQDGVYRMVGIPDGLGAFSGNNGKGGGGTFTVLMNHELSPADGVIRDHGSTGSFVSRWELRKGDLKVVSGDDQIKRVFLRDPSTGKFGPATTFAFNRLCSADLAKPSAFYDPRSGLGTRERLFLNGEETRPSPTAPNSRYGKAFAHVVTGNQNGDTFEIPEMGEMAFENVVASPHPQRKTVVVNLDDSSNAFTYGADGTLTDPTGSLVQPSEVYVYVGEKKNTGNPVERAGLTGGALFGVKVAGKPTEANVVSGDRFDLALMSKAAQDDGTALQAESVAEQVTQFRRVEDGQWDPTRPNDFYYCTTDRFGGQTRLWRLRFDDVTRPERGGRIDIMLDSGPTVPGEMFDNMTIDSQGRILLQEDPGNNPYLARMYTFDKDTRVLTEVAQSNPNLFLVPPGKTVDEEHSGIIDVSEILGPGHYLFDTQAHLRLADPELVEDGQLQAMKIDFGVGRIGYDTTTGQTVFVPGEDSEDDDDDENRGGGPRSVLA